MDLPRALPWSRGGYERRQIGINAGGRDRLLKIERVGGVGGLSLIWVLESR